LLAAVSGVNGVAIGVGISIPIVVIALMVLGYALKKRYQANRNKIENEDKNVLR